MATGDMPLKLSPSPHLDLIRSIQNNPNQSFSSSLQSNLPLPSHYPPRSFSNDRRLLPQSQIQMEGDQQKDERSNQLDQQGQNEALEVPDLALTLQALSLAEPGLCRVQNSQAVKEEDLDFSFCLLLKVACTGGTPKNLSQPAIEEAMARAWRDKYCSISQVSNSVFLAHFRTQEDMISIYTRQPWTVNTENLLLDWFDPNFNANSSSDYRFDHILVNVRAYGIPRNRRSLSLLVDILNQVGVVSEFHVLQETNLFAKQDYIFGTVKMKVNNPVKDRVILTYADNTSGLAYLHYERIKRICLFCGVMFHHVQNCSWRNNLVTDILRSKKTALEIPTYRFGQWITDERCIPMESIQAARAGSAGNNQAGNAILSRLQRLFAEDPKGKAKISGSAQEHMNSGGHSNQGHSRPSIVAVNIGQYSRASEIPLQRHLTSLQDSPRYSTQAINAARPTLLPQSTEYPAPGQHVGQRIIPSSPHLHKPSPKRPPPSLPPDTPPLAKRASPLRDEAPAELSLLIHAAEATSHPHPPANSLLPLSPHHNPFQHKQHGAAAHNLADVTTGDGILGARPNGEEKESGGTEREEIGKRGAGTDEARAEQPRPIHGATSIVAEGRTRRRPSGWDVQDLPQSGTHNSPPLGAGIYQYGSPSAGHVQEASELGTGGPSRRIRSSSLGRVVHPYVASPCRSPARSNSATPAEYEPWSLRPVSSAWSRGSEDSRCGAFSPPQMVDDYYVAPDVGFGAASRGGQEEIGSEVQSGGNAAQSQSAKQQDFQQGETGRSMDLDDEALAPAFKAPRAP